MRSYESLREKLFAPFLSLGFVISAVLSLSALALVAHVEDLAIQRALHAELEGFRYRLEINPDAQPANSTLLKGYFLPDKVFASLPLPAPGQEIEMLRNFGDTEYSVLIAEAGGQPVALFYDRTYLSSSISQIALLLLIATLLSTLFSYLAGRWLASRIAAPIRQLVDEVARSASLPLDTRTRFDPAAYPLDEIGRLVRELDRFADRLFGFAERERFFAADVSHELRTPIAVILGACEVLGAQPGMPEPLRQRVANIQRQATRMARILEAMLLLGREDNPEADPACAIAGVVDEAVSDCTALLVGRPVVIETVFRAHPILPVEPSLAYVVVSNILRNACAFTQAGKIVVTLDHEALTIADSGTGIPGERLPGLFQRHAKGEGSQGHGLGLSIVARICQRAGWEPALHSVPGEGTEVRIDFSKNL